MKILKMKVTLTCDEAWRLSAVLTNSIHENEKIARFYAEKEDFERADFFTKLASRERILKANFDAQLQDDKSFVYEEDYR